jgi:hypothetical protein
MAELSLRQFMATIDARTAEIDRKLDAINSSLSALHRMTARLSDGRTLVNAVATILSELEKG